MSEARILMIVAQALVLLGLVGQFAVPVSLTIEASRVAQSSTAVPVRFLLPLLLMTVAGLLSAIALVKLYR